MLFNVRNATEIRQKPFVSFFGLHLRLTCLGTTTDTCTSRCESLMRFFDSWSNNKVMLHCYGILDWRVCMAYLYLHAIYVHIYIYIIQFLHADSISLTPPRARHLTLRKLLWRKVVTLLSACSGRNYNFRCINVVFWRVFARDSAPGG